MDKLKELLDKSINTSLISCVLSNKKNKLGSIDKVKLRQVMVQNRQMCQITEYSGTKVFHRNISFEKAVEYAIHAILTDFKQCQIQCEGYTASVLISSKGQITIREKTAKLSLEPSSINHNRTKEYLLPENTPVPFLKDLGVMTDDGKIIKSKYDKFKQINRFLEFIRDILPSLDKNKTISILDFGCGKSYLTFAMYYYLKEINGYNIRITGLDLKKDVIAHCNSLAEKYGYNDLHFFYGDVADYEGTDNIDMMVTLHACDTATDYALAKAVMWNAKVILSVPCCQHEFNKTISNRLLSPVLKYGIIKERTASLLTYGIRGCILDACGYDTQILEFINMEHTPKNLLIRAVKRKGITNTSRDFNQCLELIKELNVSPTLYNLSKERGLL